MISALMASEKEVLTMTEYIENPLSGKRRMKKKVLIDER